MGKNLVLLFLLPITLIANAQPEKAEAAIDNIMKELSVTGLSVAVVKKHRIIYAKSFGYQNLEQKKPLTNENIFRIASISKSFSATAIMQLVEKGKISLDDDVSNLIGFSVRHPQYPEKKITLRMLLSHRSSLNDSQGYFNLDVIDPATNPGWSKCYNNYAPGEKYQYCNLNFNMLGTIIERVSEERFDLYIKHHILDPLNIYGGYCVDSLDKSRFVTLYEYRADSAKFIESAGAYTPRSEEIRNGKMGRSTPVFSPTGGMKISAPGLATYMIMHSRLGKFKGGRIISKKSARLMQTPLSTEDGYGLAIMNTDKLIPGIQLTGHTGGAYGLNSAMFFNPKKKYGFVVMCSGSKTVYRDGFPTIHSRTLQSLYDAFIK